MLQSDPSNAVFQMAADMVRDTSQHIFLTGKAGTGKTTFLKLIKETSPKNTVIVAPTGVAAINAGGVTIHSFFQLPRGVFVPGSIHGSDQQGFAEVNDRHSIFRNIRFNSSKRQLLEELELLVIDEISMVRCDTLDAIDAVLRHYRRVPHLPYGGVQVVYIGDLFQLPPVVINEEWEWIRKYYQTPFFFSARVIAEAKPLHLELKKIYRQSDQHFIDILNRIRNNTLSGEDYEFLNNRYDPTFNSSSAENYITIATHNRTADAINASELKRLPGKLFCFNAVVKNEFSDKALPTEIELCLKEGAQIMFIKNDSGEYRRFFNGRLAIVKKLTNKEITVVFDDGKDLVLEQETWRNIRYTYNKENGEIDEEELGSFTQYPVRLAWAITVHKSQGLTFERAIIDAAGSFAPGQAYVALSRCTSLEGVVLRSKILPSSIITDKRILEFSQNELGDLEQLRSKLETEKRKEFSSRLIRLFDFSKIEKTVLTWMEEVKERKANDAAETITSAKGMISDLNSLSIVARKFNSELTRIFSEVDQAKMISLLKDRLGKAIHFFVNELATKALKPVQAHISGVKYHSKVRKYLEEVRKLESATALHCQKLLEAKWGDVSLADSKSLQDFNQLKLESTKPSATKKVATHEITFDLYQSGKTLHEIALIRNLSLTTIEGHLAKLVLLKKVNAFDLVDETKINSILHSFDESDPRLSSVKEKFGDEVSFFEIKVALSHGGFGKPPKA